MNIDPTFFFAVNAILTIAFYHIGRHLERREWQKRQCEADRIRRKYSPAADR